MTWIRRKVIFALLKSVVLCLRGSRTPWVKDNLTDLLSYSTENSELLCSFQRVLNDGIVSLLFVDFLYVD